MSSPAPAAPHGIDIAANRSATKYRPAEQLLRVLWSVGRLAFSLSPRPFFAWRRVVLRTFGARVGAQVHIYPGARVFMPWKLAIEDWASIGDDAFIYSLGPVRIRRGATVSYRAHVCTGTHDLDSADLPLVTEAVDIGEGAWIGTDAFIGPGVTIGEYAVVGARAVVVRDVEPFEIVVGNPARVVGKRRIRGREDLAGTP